MTLSLARIEELEFQLVGQLADGDLSNVDRQKAQSALTKLRELKKAWLADHPDILRKASKIHTEPHRRDRGNALDPDDTLGSKPSPLALRAPNQLRNMTIHTVAGMIRVPDHGVIEVHPDHTELHAELRGRGFRQLHGVDAFGKASTAAVAMFRPDRLTVIGADEGFLRAMHRRADTALAEKRIENFDGPQPAPTYWSAAEFRKRFFGQEI